MSAATWLTALAAVVKLITTILAMAQETRAEGVGRAQAIQEAAEHVTAMVQKAAAIRKQAASDLSDPAHLRDPDGMQRD